MFDAAKHDKARLDAAKSPPLGGTEEAARKSRAGGRNERIAGKVKSVWAWFWALLRAMRPSVPVVIATGLTILAFRVYWNIGVQSECVFGRFGCISNWDRFWKASPNEMGDTLAGLTGGLVLIWVVASVFMQNRELRETRKEVADQRKATEAMADAMKEQAALLKEERLENTKRNKDAEFREWLKQVQSEMNLVCSDFPVLKSYRQHRENHWEGKDIADFKSVSAEKTIDLQVIEFIRITNSAVTELASSGADRADLKLIDDNKTYFISLALKVQEMADLLPELSAAMKIRALNMQIETLNTSLNMLVNLEYWGNFPAMSEEPTL